MTQVLPIHVINLDRRPDRMGQMAATLDALGLSYTRIPACDGKTAEADTLDRVIAARGPLGAMSPATRACSVSHLRVWHHILSSSQDYALVLEDDMRLAPDLAALARDTRWFPRGTQAVKLEKFKPGTSRVLLGPRIGATPSGRDIHPLWSRHCGSGAYVISRRGAELAAAQAGRMRVPIDHFLFNDTVSPIRAGLAPSIVVPPMATQVETEQGSDIATAHGLPPLRLAARELRRGLCEFGQVHRQLARLATGRGRITPIAYYDIVPDGAVMPPPPPPAAP